MSDADCTHGREPRSVAASFQFTSKLHTFRQQLCTVASPNICILRQKLLYFSGGYMRQIIFRSHRSTTYVDVAGLLLETEYRGLSVCLSH